MNIPDITIGVDAKHEHYGIMGWEEFHRYARLNLSLYHSLIESTQYMTEVDRLRVMLWHYVNEAETAKALYYTQVRNNPPAPVTGPNGETYRYVGP